ncbi:hypothetical protein [Halalkalicoccus jeotgali]|uniref:Uncharacterized protein n=1 Tax=Halalkalicoccus jeotgali (strain DSM 18796 / CECT 7217 / JCM 14584 / KCTC 4019 / B3) TaxID=795797 RepID=D8J8V3_HALJB|nr:hypothetical protein [Halalkalicoccus jeotgali]ADJ14288.1 hypothetical protein HacjB3_04485 [Halalkalicoccus jeotgali B3]ELY40550.1 hypothetical protein C497_02847 [Halalkalicoccus jeotgali B3]
MTPTLTATKAESKPTPTDTTRAESATCPDCGKRAINVQGLLDCPNCGF